MQKGEKELREYFKNEDEKEKRVDAFIQGLFL